MPAYVVADVHVENAGGYAEYTRQVLATIECHGGRFLVRGGTTVPLEGGWEPGRVVLIEFPDLDAARAWYDSPEYRAILPIRQRNSTGRLLIVEGA